MEDKIPYEPRVRRYNMPQYNNMTYRNVQDLSQYRTPGVSDEPMFKMKGRIITINKDEMYFNVIGRNEQEYKIHLNQDCGLLIGLNIEVEGVIKYNNKFIAKIISIYLS